MKGLALRHHPYGGDFRAVKSVRQSTLNCIALNLVGINRVVGDASRTPVSYSPM